MAKVIEQRLANRRQERHGGMRIGLGVADMQGFFAPVHVLKAQATDFAFAQAICRKQLKYRMIAQPSRRQVRLRSCQHRRDLLRVQRRGHIFIGVEHGTDDVRGEIGRDTTRPVQIADHRAEPLRNIRQ